MAIPVYNAGTRFPFVLGNTDTELVLSATNTLVLSQSAGRAGDLTLSAGNFFGVSQSVNSQNPVIVSASNSLSLSQTAASGMLTRTAISQLNLSQANAIAGELDVTASNTLTLTQTAASGMITRTAIEVMEFTQAASTTQFFDNAIVLTATTPLTLSQTNNRFILFADAIALTASHSLSFTQRAIFPIDLTVSQSISFTQQADGNAGKTGTSVIEFTQSAVANFDRVLTATSNFGVTQSFTYIQLRDGVVIPAGGVAGVCDITKTYSPLSGGSEGTPPLRPIPPSTTRRTDVVFYYPPGPVCDATESMTLRTPQFGDRDQTSFNRINRESRGGSLTIFRDPTWPEERKLLMDFAGLCDNEVDNIIGFLEATLGQLINLRDWNSRVWTGFITSTDTPVIKTGKDRNDVAIEMEVTDTGFNLYACNTFDVTQSNVTVKETP